MTHSIRCLNTSLRSIPTASALVPPRTTTARRYIHYSLTRRPKSIPISAQTRISSTNIPQRLAHRLATKDDDQWMDPEHDHDQESLEPIRDEEDASRQSWKQEMSISKADASSVDSSNDQFSVHLNGLFPPLQFPPDLAKRILTHKSHPTGRHGHNGRLVFLGRRALEAYLALFLNSSSALTPSHDFEAINSLALNTYVLGEHVGSLWGLGRQMRWTPSIPAERLKTIPDNSTLLKNVGLYKIQGDGVIAVVGGVFHHFGATTAHRLFHTRILPHILLRGHQEGLPFEFHEDARAVCERMGGPQGELLSGSKIKSKRPLVQAAA